jgi:2-methylaconitate cis-trans-isomerase PrpF
VTAESHDLHGRLLSMQTAHRAYAVTGAICTAVAALCPGTVVHRCLRREPASTVRIAHPGGVMEVGVALDRDGAEPRVLSASVGRTARLILSGQVHLPAECLKPR